MRALVAALAALGVTACASTPQPKGTPSAFQPVCMPCPMPCSPDTSCAPAVAAKPPAPKPAAAPAPAPEPKKEPAAAPVFSPQPGEATEAQSVTIKSSTPGAVIRYTTDGSTPTESSPEYTGPITVDKTTTIRAIAIAPGLPPSEVAAGTYTVAPPPPPEPPAPPPRVAVTKERIELQEKVFFDTGKATIKPESHALLDEVAATLKSHDEVKKVRIEGHTDSTGSAALNEKLSQQRAEAVRDYLVEKGIDAGRLEAQGFGPKRPIASNKTAAGREDNRRVELRIVQQ
jgi:outer membrane protein OmpA-like peptidoglycan-associated protein